LAQQSTIVDLFAAAERLEAEREFQKAVELYKAWIAGNGDDHLLHVAYFNYAVALAKANDRSGAIIALRECIKLKPDFYPPYINLGRVLEDSGQVGPAVAQWLALVGNLPSVNGDTVRHKLMALQQIGRVLENLNQDGAAEDALKQALDINSAQTEVIQHWIALRQRQCKWPTIQGWDYVEAKTLMAGISPLSLANLADDPMFQLARACRYAKDTIGFPRSPRRFEHSAAERRDVGRLRIGYVSSDLREHAVGFAMTDLIETHDRKHFEIYAYYCGVDRSDATQVRIKSSVDHWLDINKLSDAQAASQIAEDRIDILVDLNGYTKDARTKVFALRPAPINVNWFGYPGSMGSPYHHYLIADPHVIPEDHEIYYSEKVLRLPCYQPNDRRRVVAKSRPVPKDERLPEGAVVYCCLNGMQKITQTVFEAWLTILSQVPASVLWLLTGTDETNARLQQLAEQRGISRDRLIFAEKKPNPEHLARYPLADMFLDTFPYGAHTTAADAMWMGVPLLTVPGRSFASRVCASLVRAAGMADWVCPTTDAYIARAIELGRNPKLVTAAKKRLSSTRDTCLLFDTPQLVRHLEDLYRRMWKDFKHGSLPCPDLSHMDVYYDVGLELNLEGMEAIPDDVYRSRYEEKLAISRLASPAMPASRFRKPLNSLSTSTA
jgi:predicted O-linked N-acetylglucosamine transferase (SPINDLY family)